MHRLGYVLSEGFQLMALSTQAVFEFANLVTEENFYDFACYSVDGGDVVSSSGVRVGTKPLASCTLADTWLVTGASDPIVAPASPEVLKFLRRAGRHARRIAGLCTGGFTLAEAGLLDGRRATTHWVFARDLRQRHPAVHVDDDRIFIADGALWTSAGMTAAFDLALAMVEADLGETVARAVAHKLVMSQRRTGGQSQHSELLELAPKTDRIQQALDYARAHLKDALSVEELAEVAHLSPRQFSRVFTAETGQSPAKAVEGLRLEAARLMIEQSRHPLEVVARESGFRDRRHLREVFVRNFGVPPQVTRRGARAAS